MPITRRSRLFRHVAEATDEILRRAGRSDVDTSSVDTALNQRIDFTAMMMRVEPRTAMNYIPDDLPEVLARDVIATMTKNDAPQVAMLSEYRRWCDGVVVEGNSEGDADVINLDDRRPE